MIYGLTTDDIFTCEECDEQFVYGCQGDIDIEKCEECFIGTLSQNNNCFKEKAK